MVQSGEGHAEDDRVQHKAKHEEAAVLRHHRVQRHQRDDQLHAAQRVVERRHAGLDAFVLVVAGDDECRHHKRQLERHESAHNASDCLHRAAHVEETERVPAHDDAGLVLLLDLLADAQVAPRRAQCEHKRHVVEGRRGAGGADERVAVVKLFGEHLGSAVFRVNLALAQRRLVRLNLQREAQGAEDVRNQHDVEREAENVHPAPAKRGREGGQKAARNDDDAARDAEVGPLGGRQDDADDHERAASSSQGHLHGRGRLVREVVALPELLLLLFLLLVALLLNLLL
mmetsp:Transcript_126828/g.308197  ORF Transcript_126828/g.308197 Transcript_126828/m.308197 type:complete len:286 (-) Transcript_126828:691-1548(-)